MLERGSGRPTPLSTYKLGEAMRSNYLCAAVILAMGATTANAQEIPAPHVPTPYPCDEASGVLAFPSFASALCVDTSSGRDVTFDEVPAIGKDVLIHVNASVSVPADETVVDVFQIYNGEFKSPPALEYTATFSWTSPDGQAFQASPDSLVLREWVGNFNYNPPKSLPITYVNASDPTVENTPAEFSWIIDETTGMATGATIESRVFEALPTDILPQIERYHWQISGLPAGTEVAYTKLVTGGEHVAGVPEPAANTMMACGSLVLLGSLRRRHTRVS